MTLTARHFELLHRCESGGQFTATDCNLSYETAQKKEGKYSLRIVSIDVNAKATYTFDSAKNISNFTNLGFWLYGGLGNVAGKIRLYTDALNHGYWTLAVTDTWTWTTKTLISPDSETGTLNLESITKIEIELDLSEKQVYIDFIIAITADITSDILSETYIEGKTRNHQIAQIQAKGTWIPQKGDIIQILDYYTTAGSSTDAQIVFEGIIKNFEQLTIRKIWCESRAKRDLDDENPSGSFSGDIDSEHLKTMIGSLGYLKEGTIDATGTSPGDDTSYTLAGDKSFRNIINSLADKHYDDWALTPTSGVNFNDADVDSGINVSETTIFPDLKPTKQVEGVNKVILMGGLGTTPQESLDANDIEQNGEITFKDTYSHITVDAELLTVAGNIRTRENLAPLKILFKTNLSNKGWIQIGETLTFECDYTNPVITAQEMIIRKERYYPLKEVYMFEVTSGIVFKKRKMQTLPEENNDLIQQLDSDKISTSDILDEDDMASDSAVHTASQQSVKAFVGTKIRVPLTLIEGSGATRSGGLIITDAVGEQCRINWYVPADCDVTQAIIVTFTFYCATADASVACLLYIGFQPTDMSEAIANNIESGTAITLNATTVNRYSKYEYTFSANDLSVGETGIVAINLNEAARTVRWFAGQIEYTRKTS